MNTMPATVKALFTFGVVIALLATGYWIGSKNSKLGKAIGNKHSETVAEVPNCHPPLGDLAPDGNMFVVLLPNKREVTISTFNTDKKTRVIKLARPASDILALSNKTILISYGTSGEVALQKVEGGPEQTFKVGRFAGDMCKSAASQVLISDSASGKIYQFDIATKRVIHTYSVKGKPTHMKWLVRNETLEVFGEKGKSLGTLNVIAKAHG